MKRILFIFAILLMSIQGGKEIIQKEVNLTSIPPNVIKNLNESVPAVEEAIKPDPLTAMAPAINALVMAMVEQDLHYDSSEPTFFWTAMFYAIGINESADFRVIDQGDTLWIPEEMVRDTASALFGEDCPIPPLPQTLEHLIAYDKELYGYQWAKGDASLTECQLYSAVPMGQGVYELTGDFYGIADNQNICSFSCTLVETDSMFAYYIGEIEIHTSYIPLS